MNLLRGRIRRMEKLLDDLLDYSRIGRTVDERYAEVITGDVLAENILALLSPPEGFTMKVSPGLAGIHVRRMPLQQILMNLIGNAIKHHDKKAGCIEVMGADCGAHYDFAVKDDGPGIPEHARAAVFDPFFRLDPSRSRSTGGSGLGLAIVKQIADAHGARISLTTSPEGGLRATVVFPLASA